jgi:hypothetical protein
VPAITTPDDVLDLAPELAPLNVARAGRTVTRLQVIINDVSLLVDLDNLKPDEAEAAGRYLVAHVALMMNPEYMKLGPNQTVSAGGVSRTRAAPVSAVQALSAMDATGYGQMAQALLGSLPAMLVT